MSGYFLYHSIGTFPGKGESMAAALADFSAIWSAEDDGQWPAALAARQRFIDTWIRLIDAPQGTLTTAENVTSALYSLIGALPSERLAGKRVLVAADCFPSLHFLLAGLAQRFNFTLDTVPLRPGESWVRDEDFVARWQEDVGLALITFVTSTASHRCDVAKLAAHGRAMGSIVGVDITQGVGVVPFSVAETPVDFVVSTSLKWLCGSSGAGILQVAPDLMATCRPELRGWFSQPNPFSWDLDAFSYASDARRFDHGTPAILASVASLPGLQWVEETGIDAIRAQNAAHVGRIIDAAISNGWTIRSPLDAEKRGGSVMIGLPQGVEAAKLVATLRDERLYCDARGTTLRLSPGMVTADEAVGALIARLQDLIGSRQHRAS
ncbi:MAG: aminotransferase class V-fold PLP-dependent enzyme [Mesorhizobium sp.]|uniref:aminotransferase class V-fold PLP-dependent enzyme n=3 Tax=Mesorhizobium TaxID=68287 RepID=UPI000F755389|nr:MULTISPECIES: aminotransferase class V-fold PLP-dependent enzyme [unclassified Mesorhizobium]AZO49277.1 aminotransferase class V-fold PLP-dependent enzyme [Mesorhizobium sp. M4B.F.Ca.ET.058.02.1.1]RVC45935.1 aminotransferase class V-fold PLP-dependent enzyme [Mesorhizobium sp. M4A.F.Ca.ET.090.04.2.1]RWD05254.1 MAG: aminotransferase class V-fold PLP-dependent enzyme [Mesorhizobium sp.]RWD14711.1 MAG: aminotransferase class V-fold PLP-dependent enzyme [Mesorhizobium sp.]RWD22480.1 MAG: aminot